MISKNCSWRVYFIYSLLMLILPSLASAERERFEHRGEGMGRPYAHPNYHRNKVIENEHVNVNKNVNVNVHKNVNVHVDGGRPGRFYYNGKNYKYRNNGKYYNYYHNNNYYRYYNNGRYYNYYHNNRYFVYYNNGNYYNYFNNGIYYLYFINGIYYNYFYKGKYYKTCVPAAGNPSVMVCH